MLPSLHANWIQHAAELSLPEEVGATCARCAMCPTKAGPASPEIGHFLPELKCCSYLPDVPNFLVGRILADTSPALSHGRQSVKQRVEARQAVSPLGLGRPPTYVAMYSALTNARFGRELSMRCPHFLVQTGSCGIWAHRNAICSTWFCKHERGDLGLRLWNAARRMLSHIEVSIARWCILKLMHGERALEASSESDGAQERPDAIRVLDAAQEPERYRRAWANWNGREADFYQRCGQLVARMPWTRIVELGGAEFLLQQKILRDLLDQYHRNRTPARLRCAPFHVLRQDPKAVVVVGYSDYDPVAMPRTLFDVLHCFDARPHKVVLRQLRSKHGLKLSPELVQRLVDFDILHED